MPPEEEQNSALSYIGLECRHLQEGVHPCKRCEHPRTSASPSDAPLMQRRPLLRPSKHASPPVPASSTLPAAAEATSAAAAVEAAAAAVADGKEFFVDGVSSLLPFSAAVGPIKDE